MIAAKSLTFPTRLWAMLAAIGRWYAMIVTLMGENFAYRHKRLRLNALLALAEPLVFIAMITLLHEALHQSPPFGSSAVLFFATGVLPYSVFMHSSNRTRVTESSLRLPGVTQFDILLAHILDELLLKIVVIGLVFFGLYLTGVEEAIPVEPVQCFAALGVLALMGVGFGMVSVVLYSAWSWWKYMYPFLVRALLLFSSVMYVMDLVPDPARSVMVWDPMAHAITWFRAGVYSFYPTRLLDLTYMFECAIGMVVIGILVETSTREWRLR